MKKLKVVAMDSDSLTFDNGMKLFSDHDQDCCENHYLSFNDLTLADFDGMEFDFSNDDFFERIAGFGIALKPTNDHPVRIAGYGENNGYYSSNLSLVITEPNSHKIYEKFDITECQDY
jgi:hypothetical protein